jgi:hypothetical protein
MEWKILFHGTRPKENNLPAPAATCGGAAAFLLIAWTFVVSHPKRKNKNAPRVGHPRFADGICGFPHLPHRTRPIWGTRAAYLRISSLSLEKQDGARMNSAPLWR